MSLIFWLALIGLFVVLLFIIYASANIRSNFFVKAINKGKGQNKTVALTFDDGPCEQTLSILNILAKYNASATFFVKGKNVARFPEILRKVNEANHLIGNHSFYHKNTFPIQSTNKMVGELNNTDAEINSVISKKPRFFRPPFGVTNPLIARAIKQTKHKVIGWNIRSLDTQKQGTDKTLKRIVSKLEGEDIILLHDTIPETQTLLEKLLLFFKQNGIEVVRLDALINEKPYDD